MKRFPDTLHPHRLLDHDTPAGALLRGEAELSPPPDARERIWRRLSNEHPRLIEDTAEDARVAALLREAAEIEPPVGLLERIWRALVAEAKARAGVADPPRLLETIPLLARAAAYEPPFGRRTRLLQGLAPVGRPRFVFAAGGLSVALAAALLLFLRPAVPAPALSVTAGNDVRVVHTRGSVPAHHLGVGDRVELPGSAAARWQLASVGDVVLDGPQAEVTLASVDRHGVRLDLERGHLAIHADKRSRSAPLIIRSHGVDVEVVGTILAVDADTNGVQVFVREGLVQVRAPGQEPAYVGAGQHWPSTIPRTAGWAESAMQTLAGVKPAGRAPAATALADAQPALAAAPAEEAGSVKPIEHERAHPVLIAARDPHRVAAAPVAPPLVAALAAVLNAPEGTHYDLDDEAPLHYGNRTADFIRKAVSQSEAADDKDELAVAYLAEANAPDATPAEQRVAAFRLVHLLDDQLGATADAAAMRQELRSRFDGAGRADNQLALLEDLVELGRSNEAIKAADDCLKECAPEHRALAAILQSGFLAESGRLDEAQESSRAAHLTSRDFVQAGTFFAGRADSFEKSGQHERARSAASLALAIDPQCAQMAHLRELLQR